MLHSRYLKNEGVKFMSEKLISSPVAVAMLVLIILAAALIILLLTKKDKSHRFTDEESGLVFWIPTIFFVLACPILFNLELSLEINDIPGIYFSCVSGPALFILALFALIKIVKAKSIKERVLTIFALIAIAVAGIYSLGLYIMILNHIPIVSM